MPSYNNALVDEAPLSSQPWDSISKTGGVLSVIVGNTLSLNVDIDVSGKGFIGGSAVQGLGICVGTNSPRYDKYAFHRDSLNSGFKGEGPVTRGWLDLFAFPCIFPKYAKGKGANFTGGGGGNGRFSGGGGGLITTSNITTPGNVTKTITFGLVGTRSGVATGGNGTAGENLTSFVPVLNGFLFNSIRSSVTGNQVDSIYSNKIPKPITGTSPVGGSGTYTYLWQKSYNLSVPSIDIAGSNTITLFLSHNFRQACIMYRLFLTGLVFIQADWLY
ncbi:MAG: hypothetical protein MUO72_12830 [Bacteroidales bacterium]|nr:hypothetical protein [Bacteroidales bacterium]